MIAVKICALSRASWLKSWFILCFTNQAKIFPWTRSTKWIMYLGSCFDPLSLVLCDSHALKSLQQLSQNPQHNNQENDQCKNLTPTNKCFPPTWFVHCELWLSLWRSNENQYPLGILCLETECRNLSQQLLVH